MSTVTENITPAKAQEYLRTSLGNRPISKVYVRSYADTMRKGAWMLNGVPIIFDTEGHLLDGHHRLHAVIEAGIPVRFDVSRGAPTEAFTTYDNGRHRTVGQLLAMQSVKHYNMVASIVKANDRLIKSGRLYENNTVNLRERNTNADDYEAFRKDAEGFEATASFIVMLQSRCRIVPASWAGGIYYFLTHTGGYKEEEVKPFFESLFSLESDEIHVVTLLRKAITKDALEGRKMTAETLWAYIAKAWNAYITGTCPKILRYQGKEDIPTLKLR